MLNKTLITIFIAVTVVPVLSLRAQEKQPEGTVRINCTAEQEITVTTEGGSRQIKRVPVSKVLPASTIVYTLAYENTGAAAASKVKITNPVPENTVYLDKTAEGKGALIEFSIDGGKTYAVPGKLLVTEADGIRRPAVAAEYTHIRWSLQADLQPGQTGTVWFKVRVR